MTKIEFGWRAPTFPVDGASEDQLIREVMSYLKQTHDIFDAVWLDDHLHPWLSSIGNNAPVMECWTTLTFLSAIFTDLDFGAIVLCNSYRNPALVAKMGATLSCLTNGRFVLGIGAGWKKDEYIAYGYSFPTARERIERLEEGVKIIRKMWKEAPATYEGKHYTIKDAYCIPKPAEPPPPIMIGGGGEHLTLSVVASQADWWNIPGVSPQTYERKSKILAEHCSKVGRNFQEIRKTWTGSIAIAENDEKAGAIAEASPFLKDAETDGYIAGSPSRVREQIERFVGVGITHLNLRFLDFPSVGGAKLFGKDIVPLFQ